MADQSDDEIKPWTIKGVAPEARNAATAAAGREKTTIGEWIARAIRTQVQSDRQKDRAPVVVGPASVAPPVGIDEIERLIAATAELAKATGEPPPKTVSRAAYAVLRDRLGGAGPTAGRAGLTARPKSRTKPDDGPPTEAIGPTGETEGPTSVEESPTNDDGSLTA
jgi:hypothetical protein